MEWHAETGVLDNIQLLVSLGRSWIFRIWHKINGMCQAIFHVSYKIQ